jgi:hypothetical protein
MTLTRIDRLLGFEHGLPPAYGAIAAAVGLLFLLFGWRLHRFAIVVTGFLVGAFAGQLIARWAQVDPAWGVFIGGIALALLADPLHKIMVFVLAGLAAGLGLGEAIRLIHRSGFLWGFVPGFLAGGSVSLWQIRLVVVFSTAFLGSLMLLWGGAVVMCNLGMSSMCTFHHRHSGATLVILGLAMIIGVAVQLRFSSKSPEEEEED